MRIRPLHLVIAGFAVTGAVKLSLALIPEGAAHRPVAPSTLSMIGAAEAAAPKKEDPAPEPAAAEVAAEPLVCEGPEELLQAIEAERLLVAGQKDRLATRAAEIALAEEGLKAEKARLSELKGDVEALLAKVDAARTADLDRLVALYRNMKPAVAAGIMNDLDLEVTVMVLGAMPERDAANILGSLNLVRARAVSKIILERSKLPGDQKLNGVKLQ